MPRVEFRPGFTHPDGSARLGDVRETSSDTVNAHHMVPQQCADTGQFRPQDGHLAHRFRIRMIDENILETRSGFWVREQTQSGRQRGFQGRGGHRTSADRANPSLNKTSRM